MRTRLAGLTALFLGLAMGMGAPAQTRDTNTNTNSDRDANKTAQTIHGVIAGVTVEGELAIDYKSKKAVEADVTFLTIVGSPRGERHEANASARANDRDRNKGANRRANRHRHNVYLVLLTPKTQFRDAEHDTKTNANPSALTLDDLEVGDQVEVTINVRDDSTAGSTQHQNSEIRRKHGRHRTYFGDATSITLVSEPASENARSSDRDRTNDARDKDKDKDKDKDQNKK